MIKSLKMLLLAAFCTLVFAGGQAIAGECGGVNLPDNISIDGQSMMLNGMGIRKEGQTKNYVAGLYLAFRTSDAPMVISNDMPRRLTMRWLRDYSLATAYESWKQNIENNPALQLAAYQERMDKLAAALSDFKAGQEVVFSYMPETGTKVIVQGVTKTVIEGADFGSALISIWIGPNPPNVSLRDGLMGGPCQ